MEGTVKFFNRIKGFGFVNGDDGKDYFVHFSAVKEGQYLNEGDRVSFEGVEGDKGLKAENVELLGKGEAKPEEAEGETPAEEEQPEEEAPAEEEQSEEAPAEEETPAEEEQPEEEAPVEEQPEEEKEE